MRTSTKNLRLPCILAASAAAWLASVAAHAQGMSTEELVDGLRGGGFVIVMRHATSPTEPPPPRQQSPANVDGERQLDEDGRAQMTAMGYAFRELGLPVGRTLTSPAYRAVESAEYFGFGEQMDVDALAPPDEGGDPSYLATSVTEPPADGENRVIVTHRANIVAAFGAEYDISVVEDGESIIFHPTGDGGTELAGRMTIKDWAVAAVN